MQPSRHRDVRQHVARNKGAGAGGDWRAELQWAQLDRADDVHSLYTVSGLVGSLWNSESGAGFSYLAVQSLYFAWSPLLYFTSTAIRPMRAARSRRRALPPRISASWSGGRPNSRILWSSRPG